MARLRGRRWGGGEDHILDAAISEDEEDGVTLLSFNLSAGELDGFVDHFGEMGGAWRGFQSAGHGQEEEGGEEQEGGGT
jgi:hypothetical protein